MGSKPSMPIKPDFTGKEIEKEAREKLNLQYLFLYPLRALQIVEDVENKQLAQAIGYGKNSIAKWFLSDTSRMRLPTFAHIYKIWKFSEGKEASEHGRAFNYVFMFEGKENTDYEEKLLKENEDLKKQLIKAQAIIEHYQENSNKSD